MNDDNKTIYTAEGDPIGFLSKDKNNYLDKTTILLGSSGSGKTTVIEEILYLTKDYIPNYLVIVPKTSDVAYRKKLPSRCIREDLSKKKLEQIWTRQKNLTACYNIANDINILESLFRKAPDRETIVMLQAMKLKITQFIRNVESSPNLDYAQKKSQKSSIEEQHIKKTKAFYKAAIKKNAHILERMELSTHEKTALEYLDLNPRFMIIIDDSSDKFEIWMKYWKKGYEANPFNSIFFQGRHNFITLVFACHEDKIIDTQLRKASRVTIYTNSQTFITSIEKKSNGYSKTERNLAMRICDKIFPSEAGGVKHHMKICYVREDPQPFKYTIANLYPDFILGGEGLRAMISKMPKKEDRLEDNPFIKELASNQVPRKRR